MSFIVDEPYEYEEDSEIEIDKNTFRDEKNRYIVQGLFLEDSYNKKLSQYTLARFHRTYKDKFFPSLKQLYLEESDVTEYLFAEKWCYDWEHWQRMCKNKWLQPHIENWREELELKLSAEGISTLVELAINTENYQAAKFLADKGWKEKDGKGRPSKEKIEEAAVRIAKDDIDTEEDYKLLMEHDDG